MLSQSSESLLSTLIPKVQCTESCVMVFFSLLSALILLSCYASRCINLLPVLFIFGFTDCLTSLWSKNVGYFLLVSFCVPEILNFQRCLGMGCIFVGIETEVYLFFIWEGL